MYKRQGTVMVVILLSYRFLFRAIFGQIDADVMQNAEIYFIISAISYQMCIRDRSTWMQRKMQKEAKAPGKNSTLIDRCMTVLYAGS